MLTRREQENDKRIKFVMLGDISVGKTSLVTRYILDRFRPYTETTIGASYNTKGLVLEDSKKIYLDIWDTAGQERYRSLIPLYYRNADCVLLCVDLSKSIDIDNIDIWIDEVNKSNNNNNLVFKLIGTKSDLKLENSEDIQKILNKYNFLSYIESSSKCNLNIDKVFIDTAKEYYSKIDKKDKKDKNETIIIKNDIQNSWFSYCNLV